VAADDASFADMTRPPADRRGTGPPALDDDTVERLLTGDLDAAHAPAGYAEVAALLAAAAAEPTPDELAGQAAAVAELRTVVRAQSTARARRAGRSRRRRIGLAVAVAVGALTTGGVAAATGHLPQPVTDAARSVLAIVGAESPGGPGRAPGGPGRAPAPSGAAPGAGGATTDGRGAPAASTGGHGQDQPGPASTAATSSTDGRCRAFLAGKGKTSDPAAFEALAAAAGGRDKVAAYCQARAPGGAGRGHGRGAPPTTAGGQGHGQGGRHRVPEAAASRARPILPRTEAGVAEPLASAPVTGPGHSALLHPTAERTNRRHHAAMTALSVVFPCYNEAERLPATLQAYLAHLSRAAGEVEVLVVDDGSTDGTLVAAAAVAGGDPRLRLIRTGPNRGKGFAVRTGMLAAQAAQAVFSRARLDGFAFDAEALVLARRLGLEVAEVPVRAQRRAGSKVRVLADGRRMLAQVRAIRRSQAEEAGDAAPAGLAQASR
jgi:hypothetical protein